MFKKIQHTLALLFVISLSACSYSPDTLKELYGDIASDYASEIKEDINFSASQSAMIDDYTVQLMQWHRRQKLPDYSRYFAQLANGVKQDTLSVAQLTTALKQLDAMPHFAQATHLTYKIAAVAEQLSAQQIAQVEKSLNNEFQQSVLEAKNKPYSQEIMHRIKTAFKLLNVTLHSNQYQLIKEKSKKLYDIRPYTLQAEKQWNRQLINVLRQTNHPNFLVRFKHVWEKDQVKLTGKGHQLEQQNVVIIATLMKELISGFSIEQKDILSKQLQSISDTFGEMVYE